MRSALINFFFFIQISSVFSTGIMLSDSRDKYIINPSIDIFEDSTKGYSFEEIQNLSFDNSNFNVLGGGFSRSNLWIRFQLNTSKKSTKRWFLVCDNFFLDSLVMYFSDGHGGYTTKTTGLAIKQSQREIQSTSLAFQIPPSAYGKHIYLKVNSNDFINIPLRVVSSQAYFKAELNQHIVISIFVGIMALFLLYTTILYIRKRHLVILYLALYAFVSIIMGLEFGGMALLYLWPESDFVYQWSSSLTLDLILLTMIPFVYHILEIKKFLPRLKWFIKALFVLVLIKMLSIAFLDRLTMTMLNQIPSTVLIIFFILGIVVWRKGNKNGLFYSIGWAVYFLSIIPFLMKNLGKLETNIFTQNLPLLGTIVEMLCFSLAMLRSVEKNEKKMDLELEKNQEEIDYLQQLLEEYKSGLGHQTENQLNTQLISLLSKREMEVMELLIAGLSNPEIAERIFISVNTVKGHVRSIYEKMEVHNRVELLQKLIRKP